MADRLSNHDLDNLRTIGDPSVERNVILTKDLKAAREGGLGALLYPPNNLVWVTPIIDQIAKQTEIAKQTAKDKGGDAHGVEINGEKLVHAQRLFAGHGNEIAAALLLAALPQTYAAEPGSAVLTATGRLEHDLRRRVRGTAQFLLVVMQQAPGRTEADRQRNAEALWVRGPEKPHRLGTRPKHSAPPWKMCAALRLYHHIIRTDFDKKAEKDPLMKKGLGLEPPDDAKPSMRNPKVLNQEDLLGTLLSFTIAVFEVLEKMGIRWTTDDKEAYLHAWDVVGLHLGIGDSRVRAELQWESMPRQAWQGLRPPSVRDTEDLLDQIRRRHWLPLPQDVFAKDGNFGGVTPGRLLLRELTEELSTAMAPRTRSWPLALMRYYAPAEVQDRLLLGAPGVILGSMPHRARSAIARTSAVSATGRPGIEARIIRMMSNEVARRSMIHFIRDSHFEIPGLEDWADGLGAAANRGRA